MAEAKYLLLFLRSVTNIEVYRIDPNGKHVPTFSCSIMCPEKMISKERKTLLDSIKCSHKKDGYNFSDVHGFIVPMSIAIFKEQEQKTVVHRWLVAHQVGSTDECVRDASSKQKVFPWVGAALEIDQPAEGGRIFCFLPMPVDMASNLPVHVNGTFGLTDDRRSIKWPGADRKNDPVANWNDLLVRHVLPSCYTRLLLASKKHCTAKAFYQAWPDVECLMGSHWEPLLNEILGPLLSNEVIYSEPFQCDSQWVYPTQAVFFPRSADCLVPEVVEQVLSNCGVKLSRVPEVVMKAFEYIKCTKLEVSPHLTRSRLLEFPSCYSSCNGKEKLELLSYCLLDKPSASDIVGLQLLPLSNGSFQTFAKRSHSLSDLVFLCIDTCKQELLPNMGHRLVDMWDKDVKLHSILKEVASSKLTQLRELEDSVIPSLLDESMPSEWEQKDIIHFPNQSRFPSEWFELFWKWVRNRTLKSFEGKFVFPVIAEEGKRSLFSVIKLSSKLVVYIPNGQSELDLNVLLKYGIFCCPQWKEGFEWVAHQELKRYTLSFDTKGIYEALSCSREIDKVVLSQEEAKCLIQLLLKSPTRDYVPVLGKLKIFSSARGNNELYSVDDLCKHSLFKVSLTLKHSDKQFLNISSFPDNMMLLSGQYPQKQLLDIFPDDKNICVNEIDLLTSHIFPAIKDKMVAEADIDEILLQVLQNFHSLKSFDCSIAGKLKGMAFVKTQLGSYKCPGDLYDPSIIEIQQIFYSESEFLPHSDYTAYVKVLKECGLQELVLPQQIVNIINSRFVEAKEGTPLHVEHDKFCSAKAILQHIGAEKYQGKLKTLCCLPECTKDYTFTDALELLSQNRCWLPILSSKPSKYPDCLPWKGENLSNHLCSLKSSIIVSDSSSEGSSSLLYGSQVYFTDSVTHHQVMECLIPATHLVSHLKEVVGCAGELDTAEKLTILKALYSTMQEIVKLGKSEDLSRIRDIGKWIFIKEHDCFVNTDAVSCSFNPKFRYNFEPYLYKLPDSISEFSLLFETFGISKYFTEKQIASVLSSMKDDIENSRNILSPEACWETVLAIVNWLAENKTSDCHTESLCVPIQSESEWPQLKPACDVVYINNPFLKRLSIEEDLQYLDIKVSPSSARSLGITTLSEKLKLSDDTFADVGQSEPLTTRLKNILRDYKDGLTIVKELIQNADDAEATVVNLCFDNRLHCQTKADLLYPGMSEAHGPALVVHNDKVFSDEDFQNITKLAGATKQNKHLKIGKFGVGFCSVYHITDVPSFVSQQWLYIFDPTLTHLKKEIMNPALSGQRLPFTSKYIQKSKQLDPYDKLYGFQRDKPYQGTMFRFPFRKNVSELSGKIYTETTALELCEEVFKCSQHLLLFLQHVKALTFQRMNEGDTDPTTLLVVRKEQVSLPQAVSGGCALQVIESLKDQDKLNKKWLISRCESGSDDDNKLALSSVACELEPCHCGPNESYTVNKILNGEIFCFLPLSQLTGLPVHVSCNFAVINNRRGIWTSDTNQDEPEVKWNIFLMKNAIPNAYLTLLRVLKELQLENKMKSYLFYDLWPLSDKLQQPNPWSEFVGSFYDLLNSEALFHSTITSKWIALDQARFLDPNITNRSGKPDTKNHMWVVLGCFEMPLVDLPQAYYHHLSLEESVIGLANFISLFFQNMAKFHDIVASRNAIIKWMLTELVSLEDLQEISLLMDSLKNNACIPCSPDGKLLKRCEELFHPHAKFSKLYFPSEGFFPLDELISSSLSEAALKKLELICDIIPWKCVVERASTVVDLLQQNLREEAEARVSHIIEAIALYTEGSPPFSLDLKSIKFLPVQEKPDDFDLKWPGKDLYLSSGNQLVLTKQDNANIFISGSQDIFLSRKYMGIVNPRVENILGLIAKPSVAAVAEHLKLVTSQVKTLPSNWIDRCCKEIYSFLDENAHEQDICKLDGIPLVWTGESFVHVREVCFEWPLNGPYLFKVPLILEIKKRLCKLLHIKRTFAFEDLASAMDKMKEDLKEKPIKQGLFLEVMKLVLKIALENPMSIKKGMLNLPDEDLCLRNPSDLAYNDAPWAPPDNRYHFVHDSISRDLAKKLGVQPVRSKFLEKYASACNFRGGVAFGQRETLTRRIQNILRDYPLDITLLKELLQNADDAKARKLCIILDKRFHKTSSVLSEEWADLQGPALLVWNDSIFSENDLEGIQELGLGSKRSDAETIGQYGIGFNVVYHVTDCPSFISNDETLCIMDPHCRYTPGANEMSPGRRFDKISNGFWEDFPDLKSAYLRSDISNLPSEMTKGSLFRFPIRHSERKIKDSEIVGDADNLLSCLSAHYLESKLKDWMIRMKEAMLFLNNVTELKLFIINEKSKELKTAFHVRAEITNTARADQKKFQENISMFTSNSGSCSKTITYPLTLTEIDLNSADNDIIEEWLIHQGIGNIFSIKQDWKYIQSLKPRHGIAALMHAPKRHSEFRGQVFCFLPLPVLSNFPVHVNGHFILNSTRREIWKSSDIGGSDNRVKWNENLIQALAASYTKFLMEARTHYISNTYEKVQDAVKQVKHYYHTFPSPNSCSSTYWKVLAEKVYTLLLEKNFPIFCVPDVSSQKEECITQWYCPIATSSKAQVYCWDSNFYSENPHKNLLPILQRVGLKITPIPSSGMDYFEKVLSLKMVTIESVFQYYVNHSPLAVQQDPMKIEDTVFHNVESFLMFTKYLLNDKEFHSNARRRTGYPKSPIHHFLLLTADGKLRKYKQNVALQSKFSSLFPNSLSSFLHPEFLELNYRDNNYFFSDTSDDKILREFLLNILEENLPNELEEKIVSANQTFITQERIISLWDCFSNDKMFKKCLSELLKHWALIVAQDGKLYSLHSNIVPINCDGICLNRNIIAVLKKAGMPLLNTEIVVVDPGCPKMYDVISVLNNIYHLHKKSSLLDSLTVDDLDVIIDYLSTGITCSTNDTGIISKIKSLPLFETIDGTYTSTDTSNTLIWPDEASKVGCDKWLAGCGYIFIKLKANWRKLSRIIEPCMQLNSVENHYTLFIFPNFHKLDKDNRYEQLRHIKDYLFDKIKHGSSALSGSNETERLSKLQFLKELKLLKCIGDIAPLHCVSEFCDPAYQIFEVFSWKYRFLPSEYQTEDWLVFFRKLNLKKKINENEFLNLCREVANRNVKKSITDCSRILMSFLFSEFAKCSLHFHSEVSQIPFVEQEEFPHLTWAAPAVFPCGQLVKLCGSAPISRAPLLWTVKPIVKLPGNCNAEALEVLQAFEALGIDVNPSSIDIMRNIEVLSKTEHAKWDNFNVYPARLKSPKGGMTLLKIMEINLNHLSKHSRQTALDKFDKLKEMSCIPVFHVKDNSGDKDVSKMVLVKPNQVIHNCWKSDGDVSKLHPFLFELPEDLSSLGSLLKAIGVKDKIELCHILVVLEFTYNVSKGNELDPNTDCCVKKAIEMLEKILQRKEYSVSELVKLYLPDSKNMLRESTSLLYIDSPNYDDYELHLDEVPYYHFDIRTPDYEVDALNLSRLLPKNVKPIGLSEVSQKKVMNKAIESSELASQLTNTFSFQEISEGIVLFINKLIGKQENSAKLKDSIACYLDSIDIRTVHNLKVDIIMTEDNKEIGFIASKCCLTPEKDKMVLYLDSSFTLSDNDEIENVLTDLASQLLDKLCDYLTESICFNQKNKILTFATKCLASNTKENFKKLLKKHKLNLENKIEVLEKKLGQVIPDCWHHRLAQDIDNVFNPMEYVGYEAADGHIIVAQVAFPVKLNEQQQELEKKYHIYIRQDDREGIEVSHLLLYKFLPGSRNAEFDSTSAPSNSKEVAIFDGEDEVTKIRSSLIDQNLKDIYKKLCQQLKEIWKLSISLRKTAIRRLFLFWHPDKNEDKGKSEKVFQFLLKQIEHLEKGEPLDDPDSDTAPPPCYQRGRRYRQRNWYNHSSTFNFRRWNDTAYQHGQSHESEFSFFEESRCGDQRTTTDYFPFNVKEDKRNPREGRRWLDQAEAEFRVLSLVHTHQESCSGYGYVCFMSHQVAEKALKGGVYALCGLDGRSLIDHNLCRHASSLMAAKPIATEDLIRHCASLDDYYLKTRYPNQWFGYSDIPFDHYNKEEADEAISNAEKVLDLVKSIVLPQ